MSRLAEQLPHRDAARLIDAAPKRLARLQARRKLWLQVHLWLGLIAGALLVLVGLTGSVLVFYPEIDALLNPALFQVAQPPDGEAAFRPIAESMAAATAPLPPGSKLTFVQYPPHDDLAYQFYASVPTGAADAVDERHVFVDPYRATVTGERLVKPADSAIPRAFIPFMFNLHYQLLLPWDIGGPIVGILALLMILSVLTGLIIWWPLTGKWRQALTIKRRASRERFNFDLHKTVGVYTLAVMMALLVSAVYMNLPETFYTLVNAFSPTINRYQVKSLPPFDRPALALAQAVEIANARYPKGRLDWLYPATEPDAAHTVCKSGLGLSHFTDHACVVIDQYSGKILHIEAPDVGTAGESFARWQWFLHSGQAFGLTGRILVCLTGIACALLYVTGFIRWRQKRRAGKPRVAAAVQAESA